MTTNTAGISGVGNLPPGVFVDEMGRTMAQLTMLIPNMANPRNPEDFDVDKSPAFRDLTASINQVGIREPIPVYPQTKSNGEVGLKQKAGHRRAAAAQQINSQRQEAYEGLIAKGELSRTDPIPDELKLIEYVPVAIEAPPQSVFDEKADMFLAEGMRLKWRLDKVLPFFKDTIDSVPPAFANDVEWLSNRLGVPQSRIKILIAIRNSDALYAAATSTTDNPLPIRGREKTLRAVIRAADVLYKYRAPVARKLTGRSMQDDAMLESLRQTMIGKAADVAAAKRPAGIYMERFAPRMRDPNNHSDEDLERWASTNSLIDFPGAPTTVGAATQALELRDALAKYKNTQIDVLTDEELIAITNETPPMLADLGIFLAQLEKERAERKI